MNEGRPRVGVLTMPGFGIATVQHLAAMPVWARLDVEVVLVGERPSAWRRVAASWRRALQAPGDRLHPLAESTIAAGPAESWLRQSGRPVVWRRDDAAVRAWRQATAPALTLTVTSRVLFSAPTLAQPGGPWLNVHPGLLPNYAGASPAPYMYFDGVGGCTIHQMADKVDAGALVDLAPMHDALGRDVGEYFFERLPPHTAQRMAWVLERWLAHGVVPAFDGPADSAAPLRHCSSRRLAADRQLDWRASRDNLARWVRSLAALAPAWWCDIRGRRVEVMDARPDSGQAHAAPGTVLSIDGRWAIVACSDGAVVLRARTPHHLSVGQLLPGKPATTP